MSQNGKIIKRICFTAIFSAITVILYIFAKFNLPIFPSFLDVNLSMIPVIICTFMLGPIDASICVIIRCLLKWLFVGTGTGYVGELADVLIGLAACVPAGIIYNHTNFKHKTLFAFMSVVAGWVLMGILSNIIINIPWYSSFYFNVDYYKDGVPMPLVGMSKDAFKLISFGAFDNVTKDNYMALYIFLAVIPFNLMLSTVIVLITIPVHKRLKYLYDIIGVKKSNNEVEVEEESDIENNEIIAE